MKLIRYKNITSAGVYNAITQSGVGQLWTVNINTAATGSLQLFDGQTSFGTSVSICKIDTGTLLSRGYAVVYTQGLSAVQVGAADITIGYE